MNSKFLQEKIETIKTSYLEKAPEQNKGPIKHILKFLENQFLKVLTEYDIEKSNSSNITELCSAIDNNVQYFEESVMEKLGIHNIKQVILETRREIKWQILIEELKQSLIPNQPFSPAVIKKRTPGLFNVIESTLKDETHDKKSVDWDSFTNKLPEEIKDMFQAEIVDCDEKRRIIDEETKKTIEKLGIEDAIAGLAGDPKKLAKFLELSGLQASEMGAVLGKSVKRVTIPILEELANKLGL